MTQTANLQRTSSDIDQLIQVWAAARKMDSNREQDIACSTDLFGSEIFRRIAHFAIELGHIAVINGISLNDLLSDQDFTDEEGFDVNNSLLISDWAYFTMYPNEITEEVEVIQLIPKAELINLIDYTLGRVKQIDATFIN